MAQLMMHGHKVTAVHLGAHLNPQIIDIVNVPSTGMADDFAIRRLGDLRAFIKTFGQGRKAERGEEAFTRLHHLQRIIALGLQ